MKIKLSFEIWEVTNLVKYIGTKELKKQKEPVWLEYKE